MKSLFKCTITAYSSKREREGVEHAINGGRNGNREVEWRASEMDYLISILKGSSTMVQAVL